jgi:hypothetical protein
VIFGPVSLWITLSGLLIFTAFAYIAALRAPASPERTRGLLLGAGAMALVWGASLLTVHAYSNSLPFYDQWLEGRWLYHSFGDGRFTWRMLVEPHNEHRIALKRLFTLAIFSIDGQWDNRTEAAFNTVLHALPAGLIVAGLGMRLRGAALAAVMLILLSCWGLPIARENVVWGFQSQWYLLIVYAPLAFWLLAFHPTGTRGFWLGVTSMALCLFTIATGPFCAASVLSARVLEAARNRQRWRDHAPVIVLAALVLTAGILLRSSNWMLELGHARNFGEFLRAWLRMAAYPYVHQPWMAVVIWAPSLLWLARLLRQSRPWTSLERFVVALMGFAFLHPIAIGYARGIDGGAGLDMATRYYDLLAFIPIANVIAAALLVSENRARWRFPALVAWTLVALGGIGERAHRMLTVELPGLPRMFATEAEHVRNYVKSANPKEFDVAQSIDIPFPDTTIIKQALDDTFMRSILPWTVRAPLDVNVIETAGFDSPGLPPDAQPPPTPRISFADWHTTHSGTFRARLAPTPYPFLRLAVIGTAPSALTISNTSVKRSPPGPVWQDGITVRAPEGPSTLEAAHGTSETWWGFTAPVEVGRLTVWVDYASVVGRAFLLLAVLLWLAALAPWRLRKVST